MPERDGRELRTLHRDLAVMATNITTRFTEPVRVTILIRNPAYPDGSRDVVVTDDQFEHMHSALTLAEQRPEKKHPDLAIARAGGEEVPDGW